MEFEAQNLQKVCSHDFQSIAGHFRLQTDFSTPSEGISEASSEFSEIPYQNHNVEPEQIRMLATRGFKGLVQIKR